MKQQLTESESDTGTSPTVTHIMTLTLNDINRQNDGGGGGDSVDFCFPVFDDDDAAADDNDFCFLVSSLLCLL